MNFTDPMPYKCAEFSHRGYFVAISKGNELTIYDSESFATEQRFVFGETISQIKWSPDDDFMMIILGKSQEIHLKCFNNAIIEKQEGGWECKITEPVPGSGIEGACWSSDSR